MSGQEVSSSAVDESHPHITFYPKRKPWVIFLLQFFTLGIYSCFWFIARAQELNRLGEKRYTPWLWFFVPFIVLAQLFALPKMFGHLRELSGNTISQSVINGCIAVFVLVTFVSTLERYIELPMWSVLVMMLVTSLLLAIAQTWVNRVKNQFPEAIEQVHIGLTLALGALVLTGVVGWTMVGYGIYGEFGDKLSARHVSHGEQITLEGHPVTFAVVGDDYAIVETNNPDELIRVKGPFLTMEWYVFEYGTNETIGSMLASRLQDFTEAEVGKIDCHSEKYFKEGTSQVIGLGYCESEYLGEPHLVVVSFIYSEEKGLYELYGEFSTVKREFDARKEDFIRMARGISL